MTSTHFSENYHSKNKLLSKRYSKTLSFLKQHIPFSHKILDLGINNPFSEMMRKEGYSVHNTDVNQDLDEEYHQVKDSKYEVVTAFEIFEHLVAPYNVLKEIKADYLVASVPLKLWFASAYWNEDDAWDRHYHEFEPRQFDMLLDKAGWEIKDSKKWKSYSWTFGIRPLLRFIYPRYYIVYCERKKN